MPGHRSGSHRLHKPRTYSSFPCSESFEKEHAVYWSLQRVVERQKEVRKCIKPISTAVKNAQVAKAKRRAPCPSVLKKLPIISVALNLRSTLGIGSPPLLERHTASAEIVLQKICIWGRHGCSDAGDESSRRSPSSN